MWTLLWSQKKRFKTFLKNYYWWLPPTFTSIYRDWRRYVEAGSQIKCYKPCRYFIIRRKTLRTSRRDTSIQVLWWFVLIRFQASNVCRVNPVEVCRTLSALERIYMVSTLEFITYTKLHYKGDLQKKFLWTSPYSVWEILDWDVLEAIFGLINDLKMRG